MTRVRSYGGSTFKDKYGPAMAIETQAEADTYFEQLVQEAVSRFGVSRENAETSERQNLGYYAGYYDHETRRRVEKLFRCEHPIFGSIEKNGPPTAAQAFAAGVRLGEEKGKRKP